MRKKKDGMSEKEHEQVRRGFMGSKIKDPPSTPPKVVPSTGPLPARDEALWSKVGNPVGKQPKK